MKPQNFRSRKFKNFNGNKFIKVKCNNCKNEQVIFERATSLIKCPSCNAEIAKPKGGKAEIKAKIIEILK